MEPPTQRERQDAIYANHLRWVTLDVTIKEITEENRDLVQDLTKYDPATAIPRLAALLTIPDYQSNCVRIEILIALAVTHCRGNKSVNFRHVINWYSMIGKSLCVRGEDPAEDVFVSLVQDENRDYRLLEGIWESAGFYTRRVLDVIKTMPDIGKYAQIKKSVRALLVISDIICEKSGLTRYQLGSVDRKAQLLRRDLPTDLELIARVSISFSELDERGISPNDLDPFLLHPQMRKYLPDQQVGLSQLDRHPLMVMGPTHLTAILPTAISVAARDYVIANILEADYADAFDRALAESYSKLFFNTPLLGGPSRVPIRWNKCGVHRWSTFYCEIDQGHYISFHLYLPSIRTHSNRGFKGAFERNDELTETLNDSILKTIQHIETKPGFKKGLSIIVSCGWGRGNLSTVIEPDHANWRHDSMSVADLVRLSCLGDISPQYFWRVQDGRETIEKAGVQIMDLNGILNLIGWVRRNDGHFVPHAELPDGKISPERPLLINPPSNLLREVRAAADHGYDRHCTIDNTGRCHDVQRVSAIPYFSSESSLRIYASLDAVEAGTLASVYEGALTLWMSITAPNIPNRDIPYRLWEMANEWLHRIGSVLDQYEQVVGKKHILKIHVEFLDDHKSSENASLNATAVDAGEPELSGISALCVILPHDEPHAYKVIFNAGFIANFRFADNRAERQFVTMVVRAYLQLLKIGDDEEQITSLVSRIVTNDEARNFHMLHAQKFMDYVHDSLDVELVVIDTLDDAATRIGLGWRATDETQGNRIEGKAECSEFLKKIIDVLLTEITNELKGFDRISTLRRLVANCEKAANKEHHWKRTSAALIGLHGDNPSTENRIVEQLSKFAGASISSRILAEIALCACPLEGGLQLSDIELSKLIARAGLLMRIGGLSDAIYYNALAPDLMISPLGDILFRDDFGQLVVEPMLARAMGNNFKALAPRQKKNYEAPDVVPSAKDKIEEEFWNSWKIETGFNIDEARNIIEALENKGIADMSAIYVLKRSSFVTLVCSKKISEQTANKFLEQFTLATRPQWDRPPKPYNRKDIYPWRFGRRLSLVSRPIIQIDNSEDPQLLIAPSILRKGFAYIVNGAYSGTLDQSFFRSKEMRDVWWGKASEGHTFNTKVVKALLDSGWQVRENIGLPEILKRRLEKDFGDVDALAWKHDRKEILVIECKDLSFARNYSEIASQLSNYQGDEFEGEPDKLRRHLNRVKLLQDNLLELQLFTNVKEPKIVSGLVFSGIVPMQYAKIDALADTVVGEIADILRI